MATPEQALEPRRPLLSFAIPTYNFGRFIGETVRSIIEGATEYGPENYEIVILDGGSQDDTDKVIAELGLRYWNLRYQKNPTRGGIDRDMNEVAGLAEGEFIWLFSADDLLVPGWDKVVFPHLRTGKDLYLVPAELCDFNMGHLRNNPIFHGCEEAQPVEFNLSSTGGETIDTYLKRANTLEALFSFMSAVIVKRSVWHELKERPDYYGSCWAHCARLIPLLFGNSSIVYINRFLILKRGGNDSFMENGFVSRVRLAVDGWHRIIGEFFHWPTAQEIAYALLRRDISIAMFLYGKVSIRTSEESVELWEMARMLYAEKYPTVLSKIYYWVFCLSPFTSSAAPLVALILPYLIRIRHQMKRVLS